MVVKKKAVKHTASNKTRKEKEFSIPKGSRVQRAVSETRQVLDRVNAKQSASLSRAMSHSEVVEKFGCSTTDEDRVNRANAQAMVAISSPVAAVFYEMTGQEDQRKNEFILTLSQVGVIGPACLAARVSRSEVLQWLDQDAVFRDRYGSAMEDFADNLELVALQRARESDPVLIALLKAHRPKKYNNNPSNQGVPDRGFDHAQDAGDDASRNRWKIGDRVLEF